MDSAGTSNACTTNIKFYESLSDEVIEEVCSFLSKEADWNQVPFDLKVANCFAIVRNTEGTIIGFSTTNILSPRNLWLGNVCVAKSTRKTGLASAIVKAILDRASKQR